MFNQKPDLDFSSDIEGLTTSKNSLKTPKSDDQDDITVKDLQLTGSMFDTVPEDVFFKLD